MGLTSTKLELLVGLLATAGFAASVWWLWPRLSSNTWHSILGRIGVLLGNQVIILLALGLVINNYFGFYGSWADLLGTDSSPAAPILSDTGRETTAARSSSRVRIVGSERVSLASAKNDHSGGKIKEVVISGGSSGLKSSAYVYLPRQYFAKKNADTRFPVIVALTGYPGDPRNLITRMNMPTIAAKAIDRKEMAPTIMVMMRPTVAPPRDTECMDVPHGPQVETYFTKDLREAMARAFRVGTDASAWGILGPSTGGYCALKFTMRHPEAYSAAVSLSGYFKPPIDATTGDLYGGSPKLEDENDMMWRLANLPHPPVSVLVTSSRKGESNYQATLTFLHTVRPPMRASSLILASGGHNFNTWNRETPQALPWLARQLDPPAGPPAEAPARGTPPTS